MSTTATDEAIELRSESCEVKWGALIVDVGGINEVEEFVDAAVSLLSVCWSKNTGRALAGMVFSFVAVPVAASVGALLAVEIKRGRARFLRGCVPVSKLIVPRRWSSPSTLASAVMVDGPPLALWKVSATKAAEGVGLPSKDVAIDSDA